VEHLAHLDVGGDQLVPDGVDVRDDQVRAVDVRDRDDDHFELLIDRAGSSHPGPLAATMIPGRGQRRTGV
jgi:hypothetical protein